MKSLLVVAGLSVLAACTTVNPDVVSRYDAQRMSTVVDATVLSVRPVNIQGRDSGVGTVSGAVIGGIAGSNVGQSAVVDTRHVPPLCSNPIARGGDNA